MQVGVMITNGGKHTPMTWALATVRELIQINPQTTDPNLLAAKEFECEVIRILEQAHDENMKHERTRLDEEGCERLVAAFYEPDISPRADRTLEKIVMRAASTPFVDHFAREDVRTRTRRVLIQHFINARHMERGWFADANPDDAFSKRFKHGEPIRGKFD